MVSFVKNIFTKKLNNLQHEQKQLQFLKRLHRLLDNGYPLVTALEVLRWDVQMELPVSIIHHSLKAGRHLDEAFSDAKFHQLIIVYLYFVRINGNLIASLQKSIAMFEQRMLSIQKFKQVIRYPIILFFIFILLLLFIKLSVLPSYLEMFQLGTESTHTVQLSIFLIDFVSTIILFGLGGLLLVVFFWSKLKDKLSLEKRLQIYGKVPVYRDFLRMQTTFYFATHLSMFLKTGMSIKNILEYMEKQEELPIIAYYAGIMQRHLMNGYYLNDLLRTLPMIDNQLAHVFQKNNNTDALEKDLATYADFIAENLEQKIMRFITLVQPIFFSVLGFFIIFIYVTLMWPMFQLIKTI